jgi:hypothetical protein
MIIFCISIAKIRLGPDFENRCHLMAPDALAPKNGRLDQDKNLPGSGVGCSEPRKFLMDK